MRSASIFPSFLPQHRCPQFQDFRGICFWEKEHKGKTGETQEKVETNDPEAGKRIRPESKT